MLESLFNKVAGLKGQINSSFKHQQYCFLSMFRKYTDHKFHNIYHVFYNFGTIYGSFLFFKLHRGNSSLHVGPSENDGYLTLELLQSFFFLDHPKEDHNEREIKPYITGEMLDLRKNTATEYVRRPQ